MANPPHVTLIPFSPPSADVVPSEQIIDIGRKARLECLTEERDRGAIEWRKDGRALPARVARLVATRNVLQIFNLQREDYGMYQCFVGRGVRARAGAGTGGPEAGHMEAQAGSELRLGGEAQDIRVVDPELRFIQGI